MKLSLWDRLRGITGYTLEIKTHKGWQYLHPNRDGSPYLRSKKEAEEAEESLGIVPGMEVRVVSVKGVRK